MKPGCCRKPEPACKRISAKAIFLKTFSNNFTSQQKVLLKLSVVNFLRGISLPKHQIWTTHIFSWKVVVDEAKENLWEASLFWLTQLYNQSTCRSGFVDEHEVVGSPPSCILIKAEWKNLCLVSFWCSRLIWSRLMWCRRLCTVSGCKTPINRSVGYLITMLYWSSCGTQTWHLHSLALPAAKATMCSYISKIFVKWRLV